MKNRKHISQKGALMDHEMKEKVILFVTGELAEKEQREVLDWIRTSSRNMDYYQDLLVSMKAADYYSSDIPFNKDKVLTRVKSRIDMESPGRRSDYRTLFRVAASLLVIFSVLSATMILREHRITQSSKGQYQTIESPFGSRTHIWLPDSTHVVLNAGSKLRYPVDYLAGEAREVTLTGEGFFNVRKLKRSTFIVRAGDIEVTALGTSFNIKAYPEEEVIEATLVEGRIKVYHSSMSRDPVYLKPNERLSILKEKTNITNVTSPPKKDSATSMQEYKISQMQIAKEIDPAPDISWKEKEWIIRGKTMEEMAVMLERRYNVKISLGDEVVNSYRFTGTLKDETLQQVLFAISSIAPVEYRINGNLVVLSLNQDMHKRYQEVMK